MRHLIGPTFSSTSNVLTTSARFVDLKIVTDLIRCSGAKIGITQVMFAVVIVVDYYSSTVKFH